MKNFMSSNYTYLLGLGERVSLLGRQSSSERCFGSWFHESKTKTANGQTPLPFFFLKRQGDRCGRRARGRERILSRFMHSAEADMELDPTMPRS